MFSIVSTWSSKNDPGQCGFLFSQSCIVSTFQSISERWISGSHDLCPFKMMLCANFCIFLLECHPSALNITILCRVLYYRVFLSWLSDLSELIAVIQSQFYGRVCVCFIVSTRFKQSVAFSRNSLQPEQEISKNFRKEV